MKKNFLFFVLLFLGNALASAQDGRHLGLDYSLTLGYDFMTSNENNDNGSPTASIAIGKQFNSILYVGGRVGAQVENGKFTSDSRVLIPIMVDVRTYVPTSSKVNPFCDFETGFIVNTQSDNGGESNHVGFTVMPGLSFNLSERLALDLSGGYFHRFRVGGKDKGSKGYIGFRVGVRFHK